MRLAAALFATLLTPSACRTGTSRTTDTRSTALPTREARVAFLRRYLELRTPVEDAAFHVLFQDNGQGLVPGPSDFDVRAALLVSPSELPRWTEGLAAAPGADLGWADEIVATDARFHPASAPRVYRRGTTTVVAVFETEGLVLERVASRP